MTNVLTTPQAQPGTPAGAPSVRAVPTAIWVALGALALATAGLAGALFSRSADTPPATHAAVVTVPATAVQGQSASLQPAAPAQALVAEPQAPAAQQAPVRAAAAKPAPAPAKPAPRPSTQVAQAPQSQSNPPLQTTRAAVCSTCGTIESVNAVQEQGQGTGLGAVAGGVAGALLGNQVGGGNGKKAMTVIGAVGGGLAGHEVEKRVRATTTYDVRVRMEDGSIRSFRQAEPMTVGTRVVVDGSSLRVSEGAPAPAPRAIYTRSNGA